MKKYYVYEWFDKETNIPFYVGKGSGNRMNVVNGKKDRSKAFMNYYNSHKCGCRKVEEFDEEEKAYKKEKELISFYKKQGYSLVNIDEGGKHRAILKGELNPMYGISPQERMSDEVYSRWYEKHKSIIGKKNPNYGKHTLKGVPKTEEFKKQISGGKNGRAIKIRMWKKNSDFERIFTCKKDCAQYLVENNLTTGTLDNIRKRIDYAMKKEQSYLGYEFEEIK